MHARYISGDFKRRFVCITFDDGYKDLMRWAYPLLKKYEMPFALYIPTSFPDRLGELWWVALEAVIAQQQPHRHGDQRQGSVSSIAARCGEKRELYDEIYGYLRSMKTEDELRNVVRDLAACHRVDIGVVLPRPVHGLAGDRRSRRRSAGHDRRPHRQSQDAQEDGGRIRRARGNGNEPRRAGSGARQTAGSIWPIRSAIRPRPARANSASPPSSASRPR